MATDINDSKNLAQDLRELETAEDQAVKLGLDLVLDVIRDLAEVGNSPARGASKALCAAIAHLGNGAYQLRKEIEARELAAQEEARAVREVAS